MVVTQSVKADGNCTGDTHYGPPLGCEDVFSSYLPNGVLEIINMSNTVTTLLTINTFPLSLGGCDRYNNLSSLPSLHLHSWTYNCVVLLHWTQPWDWI